MAQLHFTIAYILLAFSNMEQKLGLGGGGRPTDAAQVTFPHSDTKDQKLMEVQNDLKL
jgi:hypothetical protein